MLAPILVVGVVPMMTAPETIDAVSVELIPLLRGTTKDL